MSDEIDPDLKRLFAATAEQPSDEAFVAAVADKTTQLRRLNVVGGALILFAAALVFALTGLNVVIGHGASALAQVLTSMTASPAGCIALLALAVATAVCLRLLSALRGA
jgi:hypothetical protein